MKEKPPRKVRPEATIKTLSEEVQAEIWERQQQPYTSWADIRAWLKSEHGLSIGSDNTCTVWRDWYWSKQRSRAREAKIQGLLDQEKRLNPSLTDAQLFALGQRFFSELAIAEEDAKTWTAVHLTALKKESVEQEWEKIRKATQTKLEAGLDEIARAFKSNPKAMELYSQARALISKELSPA